MSRREYSKVETSVLTDIEDPRHYRNTFNCSNNLELQHSTFTTVLCTVRYTKKVVAVLFTVYSTTALEDFPALVTLSSAGDGTVGDCNCLKNRIQKDSSYATTITFEVGRRIDEESIFRVGRRNQI